MKEYKDVLFNNDTIAKKIKEESDRQIMKWGIQIHTLFEWLTYTTEELGELAEAISEYEYRNGNLDNIEKEAIQVATLATKIASIANFEKKILKEVK